MKLIVGLGNPGQEYELTRHNVGFLLIDRLVDRYHAQGPKVQEKGVTYTGKHESEKCLLVKPQTFMNLSGRCVAPLYHFYKLEPKDLIVIHDDLDLPFPSLRIKTGGGTGGHNGLKSIDSSLGSEHLNYHRIRIGIGKPVVNSTGKKNIVNHVLEDFSDSELKILDEILEQAEMATDLIIQDQILSAMNRYNRKTSSTGET